MIDSLLFMETKKLYKKQQDFFKSNTTKDVSFRIAQLKKLKKLLKTNEQLLYDAIQEDFGKSEFETYVSELSQIYHELNLFIKKTKKWSKRRRVTSGLANFPANSYILPEPLGVTLVIGAWNYPYLLSLVPAITALAAGNTVFLKPSELPAKTSKVMAKIINNNFSAEYFHVVQGGVKETTALLENRFDKIFFTGSTTVGKVIYKAAAKHLTPVTLELGGKSPAFVLADTDIRMSAKRMVWSKFLNSGQTCVAPDYIFVHQSIEQKFLKALREEIETRYTASGVDKNLSQIINIKNFNRLSSLIDNDKIFCGGITDAEKRFISPTVLHNISLDDEIMKDEIFGPLLPVVSFSEINEAIEYVKDQPKPLACYVYSKNKKQIQKILKEVSFGGGCVNDGVMHLSNINLPFGGVGASGLGNYHGKFGFDAFSHKKGVLHKPFWLELSIKYTPHSLFKKKLIQWFIE